MERGRREEKQPMEDEEIMEGGRRGEELDELTKLELLPKEIQDMVLSEKPETSSSSSSSSRGVSSYLYPDSRRERVEEIMERGRREGNQPMEEGEEIMEGGRREEELNELTELELLPKEIQYMVLSEKPETSSSSRSISSSLSPDSRRERIDDLEEEQLFYHSQVLIMDTYEEKSSNPPQPSVQMLDEREIPVIPPVIQEIPAIQETRSQRQVPIILEYYQTPFELYPMPTLGGGINIGQQNLEPVWVNPSYSGNGVFHPQRSGTGVFHPHGAVFHPHGAGTSRGNRVGTSRGGNRVGRGNRAGRRPPLGRAASWRPRRGGS